MSDTAKTDRRHWCGRIASGLVVAVLLSDAAVQILVPSLAGPMLSEGGFDPAFAPLLGAIMIACAIVYAVPATTMLGAILITGFVGGAICTHVRMGEIGSPPEFLSLLLGLLTWGGLYLREPRLGVLLPIRRYS